MDVYPRALYVAIDETPESISKFLNGNDGDEIPKLDDDANACEIRVSDGVDGGSLVWFRTIDQVTVGITAHECFHATMSFCNYLGINFDTGENNEHVAYMLQWCVQKVFDTKMEWYEQG